ncbi:MAG: type IV pilus twitching motility protein PilT [Actinobacteria bacterium]|nr:type IV pilus twitching motility protein PilT [Actinomycetota bacterium]
MDMAEILKETLDRQASDLHLAVGLPPMIRLDGRLEGLDLPVVTPNEARELIYSILSQDQRQKLETDWEVDLSYSLYGHARFRVNAYFQRGSLGAALRVVPIVIKNVDDLGLPKVVHTFCHKPRGFVLVTGPTGSGKSTTLAAILDEINSTRTDHIVTIEDPIEFLHQHKKCVVNQREVGTDTKAFPSALRAALRQDPDIILIGEMRDLETIQIALTAAETGHLVFATLHTQDCPQTIDRMIDVFPPFQQEQIRVQIAATLEGVVTQQLLPKAGGQGRTVACEVLISTPAARNLIREGKTHQLYTVMQTGGQYGMQTMNASLADLVRRSQITKDLAMKRSSSPDDLERLLLTGAP